MEASQLEVVAGTTAERDLFAGGPAETSGSSGVPA